MRQERDKHLAIIDKYVGFHPRDVQILVNDILKSDRNIDYSKLADKIKNSKSWDKDVSSILDSERLVNSYKSGQLSSQVLESLAETKVDAVSLAEANIKASKDNSLHALEKSEVQAIISHIQDQLAYMSHAERQEMTIDYFILNNHFSDSSAYSDYSSTVLQQKIMSILGDPERKDLSMDQVDW